MPSSREYEVSGIAEVPFTGIVTAKSKRDAKRQIGRYKFVSFMQSDNIRKIEVEEIKEFKL